MKVQPLTPEERHEAEQNLGLAYHFAGRYRVDEQERDDLIQETAVALCEAVQAYEPTRGPLAAVMKFHSRAAFKRLARSRRQVRGSAPGGGAPVGVSLDAPINDVEGATLGDTIPATGSTPEDIAAAREQLGRIPVKSDTERAVVQLRFEGEQFNTIADRVGLTPTGVRFVLSRVVSRCR